MKRLWIPLWWLALALFDAARTVSAMRSEGMQHNWPALFVIEALGWLPWALATSLIVWLARRVRSAPLAWFVHTVTVICANVTFAAWSTFLIVTFRPFGPAYPGSALEHFRSGIVDDLPTTIIFYALILAMSAFVDSRERLVRQNIQLARHNEQLAQAQLSALRNQIEPHFLFNSLNSIAGLIRENRSSEAITTLVCLSDFLRRTLSESNHQEVPLSEELDFVKQYLAMQKVRFSERLHLSVEVPAALQDAAIPNLILQPLVENAIKHGIAQCKEGGSVRIAATSKDDHLHVVVSNDGPGLSPGWESAPTGVGITNVRARLKALYGDAASFMMNTRSLGGVEATIMVPLHITAR